MRLVADRLRSNEVHLLEVGAVVAAGLQAVERELRSDVLGGEFASASAGATAFEQIVGDPPSDDPKFFGGKALTYYGRWTYKFEQAAREGAIGALIIHRTDLASYGWDVVKNSNTSEKTYLRDNKDPQLAAASWIQLDVAKTLFKAAHLDLDTEMNAAGKRGFKAVELPVRLQAHIESAVRSFQSPNVIGILPGANVADHKPDQAVMYTAHYDHLGFVPGMAGDNIYNGAADNATGCGILLELARAYASAAKKPARSILFAAVTAEEQGLLGSKYLGLHPPLPANSISLDLNFDNLLPLGEPEQVVVTGAERTSVAPIVEKVAQSFHLAIQPDDHPEAGHYYRSDHFSMARVGVPAFSINQGALFKGHDLAWGEEKERDYVAHHYHQPSDEYRPDMDFTGDAKMARFGFVLGWYVANQPDLAGWQPGDEFEKARKGGQ